MENGNPQPGPEPTGWELLRAIQALQATMSQTLNTFVQSAVYNADRRGIDERFARLETRVRDTEQELAAVDQRRSDDKEKERERDDQQRKTVASVRLAVVLAVLGPIVGFLLTRIPWGG